MPSTIKNQKIEIMKTRILSTARLSFPLASAIAALLAAPAASAATYYWDTDGTTAGYGSTAGTWGTSAFWTVTATGGSPHGATVSPTTGDAVNFGSATLALTSSATGVTVGTANAASITFGAGQTTPVTLSSGTITLGAAATIAVNNTADTIGSVLAGAATSLTKTGTGTLILSGNNTYAGGTTVSAGTLAITGAHTGVGAVTLNLGTLNLGNGTATGSLAATVLNLNGGAFNFTRTTAATKTFTTTNLNAGGTTAISVSSGNILNLGTLARATGGWVDFSNSGAGAVAALGANNVGGIMPGITSGTTWAVANGADVAISGLGSYTLTSAAGTTAANYLNNNIDVDGRAGALDAAITANSLRFNAAAANTMTLTGTTNVITTGGILVSSAVGNNLSTITGGTLAGGASKDLTVIQSNTLNGLTIASTIANNGGNTALTKSGPGLLTLAGSNIFTGGLIVNSGNVVVGSAGALNSTAGLENIVTFSAGSTGTLSLGGHSVVVNALNSNATVLGTPIVQNANSTAATLTIGNAGNAGCTFAGVIQDGTGGGALTLAKSGTGTLTLSGTNAYTGGTVISSGRMVANTASALGTGTITVNASAQLQPFSGGPTGTFRYPQDIVINNGATLSFGGNAQWWFNGNVTGNGGITASTFSFGSVVFLMGTNNTFTGPIIIGPGGSGGNWYNVQMASLADSTTANGMIQLASASTYASSGRTDGFIWLGATNLELNNRQLVVASTTIQGGSFYNNSTNNSSININTTVTGALGNFAAGTRMLSLGGTSTGVNTIAGAIIDGTSVTLAPTITAGNWVFSGTNTFTGATTIKGGTLTLANALALQNSVLDTTNSIAGTASAGLKTNQTTLTLGGLTGNKALASMFTTTSGGYSGVTALTLNPATGVTASYAAAIADGAPGMTLTKTGLGTQTLSVANTYSGATTINAGTLALGVNDVLPDTAVSIGTATLNAATFSDTLGTLAVTGAATINLSGGTLAFSDSSAIGWTGSMLKITGTFVSGASLKFGTTGTGLTAAQLALILAPGVKDFALDTNGFLIANTIDNSAPTLFGIVNDKSPAAVGTGTPVTFTVTFSEDMDSSTVSATDFGNAGTSTVTIGAVTETSPGVFTVQVTPTTAGTLQLKVNQSAVVADVAANALDTTSDVPGGATLFVIDTTPPTLTSIVDNKSGGSVIPNTLVTYTVTFNEDMDESTVDVTDFGNAGSAAIIIDSVTETNPGVFSVQVTPTTVGTLRLQVNQSAVLTDAAANPLNTGSAIPDDTTLTVLGMTAYWDRNGATAGAGGTTPTGTWDASANWNVASDGTGSTIAWIPGQTATFAAGADAGGIYNVTVSGTQDISGLTFEEGTVTLTGGTALRLVANSVADVAAGLTATITTVISQDTTPRSLTKTGDGALTVFNSNNTFGGGTFVNAGTIKVDGLANGGNPLGALGGGNVTVNNNGIISVGAANSLVGYGASATKTITINSGGTITNPVGSVCHLNKLVMDGGVLNATTPEAAWGNWNFDQGVSTPGNGSSSLISGGNATLTQAGGTVFNIGADDTLTVTTELARTANSPDRGLIKSGPGKLVLTAVNTYASATSVTAGTLSLGNSLALQNSALDTFNSIVGDATNGFKTTVTTLTLGGLTGDKDLASVFTTTAGGYDTVTGLTLNPGTGATPSYSGIIADGLPSGMTLTKTGAGTQILTGPNSYTGATTIAGGTLLVNSPGSLRDFSAVAVTAGTLGGDGMIGGSVTVAAGGSLAPGAAAGTLTIGGNLDLSAMAAGTTGRLKFELAAMADTSDKIAVAATTTIGSGVLGFSDFAFTNLGLELGTYKLISSGVGISGTLDSTNLSGSLGSGLAGTLRVTGNDVELVVTTAYANWAALKGLNDSDAAHSSAKDADPDGDGHNNLYEFAFDGNPLSAANDGKIVGKVATVSAAKVMTLTLPVRTGATFTASSGDQLSAPIDGISYRIEGDVALSPFADAITEVTGGDATAIQAGLPALSSGWTYRTYRAPGTVPTVPKAFLRAEISETP